MGKLPRNHPDEERLLRYADGELAAGEARSVRRHLEACWECRTEMDRLQATVGDCMEYRREVLQRHLSPPEPWEDLSARFESAEKLLGRRPFAARILPWLRARFASPSRWFPIAATLVLLFVVAMEFRWPRSVQAAELLRKAVVAAETRHHAPRRIRVRTATASVTRDLGRAAQTPGSGALEPVAALFRAARYDWADPLSARAYLAWHQQLPDRRDDVLPDGDCYRIRTLTRSSELVEATIKIRQDDLRAIEGRFVFRDSEWVEMAEIADEATPAITAAPPSAPSPEHAAGGFPEAPPAATVADEIAVLSVLHRLGADLGEPVEVRRQGHSVVVSGIGVDSARQQEIAAALAGLPRVNVDFSRPDPLPVMPEPGPVRPSSAAQSGHALSGLEEYFGGRAVFERFANDALERTDALMARAHALRRLDETFPPGLRGLAAPESTALAGIRRNHATVLARQAEEVEQLLVPPLTAGGAAPATVIGPASVSAADLFTHARRAERLLAVLLGGAAGPPPSPAEVLTALAELRISSRVYLGRITIEDRD